MRSKHSTSHDATPAASEGVARSRRSSSPQRSNMALCLVPLLLLGASCAGAALQRQVLKSNDSPFGHMTRTDACETAGHVFTELLGTAPIEYDASTQSAYSVRHHSIIREWSVLCSTQGGQYLLRINADTRRVYAINRMDDLSASAKPNEALLSPNDLSNVWLSHSQAEARARDYIGLIGISTRNLTPVPNHPGKAVTTESELSEPEWNFTFQNTVKQTHSHLVTISVRSKDGRLEHLWNPVLSL